MRHTVQTRFRSSTISFTVPFLLAIIVIGDNTPTYGMPTTTSQAPGISPGSRSHRHRSSIAIDFKTSDPAFHSDRVVFAERPPTRPPWSTVINDNSLQLLANATSGSRSADIGTDEDGGDSGIHPTENRFKHHGTAGHRLAGTKHRHGLYSRRTGRAARRWRRSTSTGDHRGPDTAGLPSSIPGQHHNHRLHRGDHQERHHQQLSLQPVCASVSDWIRRTEAEDFLGNRVQLVQDIDNGSARVNQYFFETFCSSSSSSSSSSGSTSTLVGGYHSRQHVDGGGSCVGIDSTQFESICYDTHTLVYGLVADYSRTGDGWTFIKVRSGCNCGLIERRSVGRNAPGTSSSTTRRGRSRSNRR